jgi:hypothetical protein
MRKRIIAVCLSFIFVIGGATWAAQVDHPTYMNYGDGIVHDVNKDPQGGDENLCWAAASANILDWTGWGDECGNEQKIYNEIFREYWTNEGGLMIYAWQWLFLGKNKLPCWLQTATPPEDCEPCPGDFLSVLGICKRVTSSTLTVIMMDSII